MKKQTLLGAAALSTVAFAGAASAQTLAAGAATDATVIANTTIASEVKLTSTTSKGVVGLRLTPSTTAVLPSGNSKLTFTLTGGATFGTAVTAGAIQTGGTCAPTTVVSTGGGANSNTVTFLISQLQGCNNTNPIIAALPIQLATGSTSAVNVNARLETEAGTAIDGGDFTTQTSTTDLIKFAKAFAVAFTADTVETKALLPGFTTLSADKNIGTIAVTTTARAKGISAGAGTTTQADLTGGTIELTGDFTTLDVNVTGLTGVTAGNKRSFAITGQPAASYTVTVAEKGTTPATVIAGSAYSANVTLTADTTNFNSPFNFGPGQLQSVLRDGSTYLIPWVASGTLAQASTSNTVIRISNITTTATGRVSAELLNSSAGVAASTALVPLATSIGSRGELVITSATLEAAFGANFGRGDVRITVEGQPANLVVRRFVQSTTNGALSEVSLGRQTYTGANASLNTEPVN